MNWIIKLWGVSMLSIGLTAGVSTAATLQLAADGQLVGATGVNVNGAAYDVAFMDGDCVAIYDGCTAGSELAFTSSADATLASQALFDEVLLGNFSAGPGNTFGIGETSFEAFIYTVFSIDSTSIDVVAAYNHQASFLDEVQAPLNILLPANTSFFENAVWAKWTPASVDPGPSPVPLPAGLPLLLIGLASFGVVRRVTGS